jgi:hypothetical protein
MRIKKFKVGRRITSLSAVKRCLDSGQWIYLGGRTGRPKHPGVIMSMTLRTIEDFIQRKSLWKAVRTTQ